MIHVQRNPPKLIGDILAEVIERKGSRMTFKVLKVRSYWPSVLYPAKPSFKYEDEVKNFPDK